MSYAAPKIFTQNEATAGQRTFMFHLTNTADGTDATGKTIAGADVKLSKAGAAFANAAGAVTELANGWYACALAAADVDTLGALAVDISEAGCDDVHVEHQVTLLDLNVATVNPGAGGITASTIAADALTAAKIAADVTTELQNGLATAAGVAAVTVGTVNRPFAMGTRTTDGNFNACSMENAIKTEITVAGTWNGATVTGQVSQDLVSWQNKGTPLTADGVITLTGPAKAFRAVLSDDGASTSLTANAQIVNPLT